MFYWKIGGGGLGGVEICQIKPGLTASKFTENFMRTSFLGFKFHVLFSTAISERTFLKANACIRRGNRLFMIIQCIYSMTQTLIRGKCQFLSIPNKDNKYSHKESEKIL